MIWSFHIGKPRNLGGRVLGLEDAHFYRQRCHTHKENKDSFGGLVFPPGSVIKRRKRSWQMMQLIWSSMLWWNGQLPKVFSSMRLNFVDVTKLENLKPKKRMLLVFRMGTRKDWIWSLAARLLFCQMFHFHFSLPKGGFFMTMFAVAKDATRHVGFGVVERTRGAKSVLFAEMSESMDVLNNVATVLEVLGKRTRDLEAQQRQILRHWQGQLRRKYRHVSYTHLIIYHIWYHMYIILHVYLHLWHFTGDPESTAFAARRVTTLVELPAKDLGFPSLVAIYPMQIHVWYIFTYIRLTFMVL